MNTQCSLPFSRTAECWCTPRFAPCTWSSRSCGCNIPTWVSNTRWHRQLLLVHLCLRLLRLCSLPPPSSCCKSLLIYWTVGRVLPLFRKSKAYLEESLCQLFCLRTLFPIEWCKHIGCSAQGALESQQWCREGTLLVAVKSQEYIRNKQWNMEQWLSPGL